MIFLCSNTLNLETIELPSWVGWGEALCAVYAHSGLGTEAILPMVCANLASFLFGIRYPISFPRNSSTCPPRYGDRRWVTVKYLSPKWLIFGFFCLFFFFFIFDLEMSSAVDPHGSRIHGSCQSTDTLGPERASHAKQPRKHGSPRRIYGHAALPTDRLPVVSSFW